MAQVTLHPRAAVTRTEAGTLPRSRIWLPHGVTGSSGWRARTCDDGSTALSLAALTSLFGRVNLGGFPPSHALAARRALPEFRLGRAADALRRLRRAARGCRRIRGAGEHAAGAADGRPAAAELDPVRRLEVASEECGDGARLFIVQEPLHPQTVDPRRTVLPHAPGPEP